MSVSSLLQRTVFVGTLLALVASPEAQAPVTLRLATGAPVNSSWHKALLDMGAQTLTAGQKVTVVIAPPLAPATTLRAFIVTGC